mmetsp:Transcript_13970/g.30333  ORF Transcript_13970/g.30333 Transcript_13970/m.30333 type:complete len:219 (-) Transcript_13970:353-1009(-)
MMKSIVTLFCCIAALFRPFEVEAFTINPQATPTRSTAARLVNSAVISSRPGGASFRASSSSELRVVTADLDTVALVAGQENLGFAVVALGEAIWSFAQAPSFSHAKVLAPAVIAAAILIAVSGPMIASGNADSVALGLEISTAVAALMGASYVARMAAPFSPSPKEAAFAGLLIAIAGFFSFSQNLVVDGFVTLPTLPSVPLPQIPLGLGEDIDTSRY